MPVWVLLSAAILAEVIGTVSLRFTDGFRRPIPSVAVVCAYALSFYLLSLVLQQRFPLSLAYAIWSAIGTALVAVIGVVVLGEALTTLKILGLVLVVTGVVALNLSGAE